MPKKYNSHLMIETILAVAARLFLEKGFDKTSMQDIARTADISKGAIYHHFQSKEEIINAVMARQSAAAENAMQGWLFALLSAPASFLQWSCWDFSISSPMRPGLILTTRIWNCLPGMITSFLCPGF